MPDGLSDSFSGSRARLLLAASIVLWIVVETVYFLTSPAIPLLPPAIGGRWIRANQSTSLYREENRTPTVFYRKYFSTSGVLKDESFEITAYRNCSVFLDGAPVPIRPPHSWKEPVTFTVPRQDLSDGIHLIEVRVDNRMAPPLFRISSSIQGFGNLSGWESSLDGTDWLPAFPGDEIRDFDLRSHFPTTVQGLLKSIPYLFPLFLATLILSLKRPKFVETIIDPGTVRYILMALLFILGVNNIFKLPLSSGFDGIDHLKYILHILERHELPLPSGGLEMFQPPFYYLVSALVYEVFKPFEPAPYLPLVLKIVPFSCSLILVEISYRTLRELFPGKNEIQSCALFVAGLLPMNLYMCQCVGNEPLAAVLIALLLFLAVRLIRKAEPIRRKEILLLGGVAGVGLLTKASPILLLPIICGMILLEPGKRPGGKHLRIGNAMLFLLVVGVIAGWFYARNRALYGKWFVGGWDPVRGIVWWQEPGYRLVGDFLSFGEALRQPVYAAFHGFADGVWSTFWADGYLLGNVVVSDTPPWNYGPMAGSVLLAVIPSIALVAGTVVALFRFGDPDYRAHGFLAVSIGIFFAALLHLYVVLPTYCTAKSSYMMGLAPAFAVMLALGCDLFLCRKGIASLFTALLVSWGALAYAGYFVL